VLTGFVMPALTPFRFSSKATVLTSPDDILILIGTTELKIIYNRRYKIQLATLVSIIVLAFNLNLLAFS